MTKFGQTVIIGFCDVSAAGCRALAGSSSKIDPSQFDKWQSGLKKNLKSQIFHGDDEVAVIGKIGNEKICMISLSAQINSGTASSFFDHVFNEFRRSESKELIIVAAIPIKMNNVKDKDVFQIAVNCDEVENISSLPDGFLIKDIMINMAIQFAQVEKIPFRCFLTQGYKISSGQPNEQDGSFQSISNLQNALHSYYGLKFDDTLTQSLVYKETSKDMQLQNIMFL